MDEQPKTLTESEVLAAIDDLAGMVDKREGDLATKATLLATAYRMASRSMGQAWADERIGPIAARMREHAREGGGNGKVERILADVPRPDDRGPRAGREHAREIDSLLGRIGQAARAEDLPAVTDQDLEWVESAAAAVGHEPRASDQDLAVAAMALRLSLEVRRLRARVRELEAKGG